VGLFFMHLKFERWNLRIMAIFRWPLALIFIWRDVGSTSVAFLELTKPRITQLVLLTAAADSISARAAGGRRLLVRTLIGVALVAAGTNAFNQVRERDVMRACGAPSGGPCHRGASPRAAALFAGVISVAGVLYLALAVNLLTAGLAALTLASYVLLYTPLKRKTTLNTLIGAVPALPIVGGWTRPGRDRTGRRGTILDPVPVAAAPFPRARLDLSGGLPAWRLAMLSVGDPDGRHTGRMVLLYAMALLPVSLLPTLLGVTACAVLLRGARSRSRIYRRVRCDDPVP